MKSLYVITDENFEPIFDDAFESLEEAIKLAETTDFSLIGDKCFICKYRPVKKLERINKVVVSDIVEQKPERPNLSTGQIYDIVKPDESFEEFEDSLGDVRLSKYKTLKGFFNAASYTLKDWPPEEQKEMAQKLGLKL